MRFMMLMFPAPGTYDKVDAQPDTAMIDAMMKYNQELTRAGVLLALDGLQSPAQGARIRFGGGKRAVADGPFSEAKEVVGGYWLIQVKSREEAIEWATRCPAAEGDMIEVRRVFEMEEFTDASPEAVATAAQIDRSLNKK